MRLTRKESEVLKIVIERLKSDFGASEVVLFGSAARGELTPGSDIDLLAIMPRADWETKKRVYDMCFQAELGITRLISVRCIEESAFRGPNAPALPLLQNVKAEGIRQ